MSETNGASNPPTQSKRQVILRRLAEVCFRRRRRVVVLWTLGIVVLGAVMGAVGSSYRTDFTLPDVESKRGIDLLDDQFGGEGAGQVGNIVVEADNGVDDPEVRRVMEPFLAEVAQIDGVQSLSSPYTSGNEDQISQRGGDAGRIAYAEFEAPSDATVEETVAIGDDIRAAMPSFEGLRIELGGQAFAEFEVPSSEALGIGFAIVILIIAFGSVLAMGLPIGVALAGIVSGSILTGLLSQVVDMPDFTSTVGVMIGLGVGIDYALFIVTRFRENLHRGHSIEESTLIAMNTAGRAVVFAGSTVVISLLGLLVMQLGFISGMAIGMAVVVALTLLASLTLLPALLGFAGERIELTRRRGLIAAGLIAVALIGVGLGIPALIVVTLPVAVVVLLASFAVSSLRKPVLQRAPTPRRETLSYRWSRVIQHRPWTAVAIGAVVLIALALPILGLRLGFSDEGNYPEDTTTRQAYDLLAEGFGPGFNGPLSLASEVPAGTDPAALQAVTDAIAADPGVAFVSDPITNDDTAPTAVLWRVTPTTAPQDAATTDLVNRLRNDVLPAATAGIGLDVAVAGGVAIGVDYTDYLAERLPYFFAAVLGLSFLLLMVVFRSLLVPLKAVIMNLLSIGAAYGIVVAVFQWGWGASLLDIEAAPIEPFVPMMLFAIVFGLSMDYEVFLLSRVREEWDRTGDSRTSVADGLASTARVITAAAAIMVVVFGSFIGESDRVVKLFGLGLSMAVLIDATIVRMLLVPATMELLGDRNWWIPHWLDRILPRVHIEAPPDLDAELAELQREQQNRSAADPFSAV
jgi:putative drug exporter of the RND superfamily